MSSTLSLALAGSPSMALTTTIGERAPRTTVRHLAEEGKPAPPRPNSPDSSMAARMPALHSGWSPAGMFKMPWTAS